MSPPRPSSTQRVRLPYLPGLDGLRGVAVAAVLLFHSDFSWAVGGHLGVSTFFTLSGFLITGLLLLERDSTGSISFGSFWARRARRLAPAMLVCFFLIAVVLAVIEGPLPSGLIGDAVGSLSWMANWRFILAERTYADLFSAPSPFQHFWSLAVEEQYYVVFPIVVGALTARRFVRDRRWPLVLVLLVLTVGSTWQAARLHDPGGATARAYYGTDARIAEILVGALLALWLVAPTGLRMLGDPWRRLATLLGFAGLAGLAVTYASVGEQDAWLYQGGFLAVALCGAAVIVGVSQSGSALERVLSQRHLVRLGQISYGVYLFHWPIYILFDERSTGLSPLPLLALRAAATLALATASFIVLESPVRHGVLSPRVASVAWMNGAVAAIAVVALASGQLPTTDRGAGAEVAARSASDQPPPVAEVDTVVEGTPDTVPADQAAAPTQTAPPATSPKPPPSTEPPAGHEGQLPAGFSADPEDAPVPPPPPVSENALRIAVVGDSIGHNLGRGLEIWASERTDVIVYNAALPGCPISRGGDRIYDGRTLPVSEKCGWWDNPEDERYQPFHDFAPQVVVVEDGVMEILDRRLPEWGEYRRPGDPRFDSWLRGEYGTMRAGWVERFGAKFVVANAPCGDWDRYEFPEDADLRTLQLNSGVYPQIGGVTVADLFNRVCPGGEYSNEVEGIPESRPDGFHFTDEAAAALARNWLGPIVLDAHDDGGILGAG